MRSAAAIALLLAALTLTAGAAATPRHGAAVDPVLGTWQVTSGGSGTFAVLANTGTDYYRVTAKTALAIACASAAAGDTIGAISKAGSYGLPAGHYKGAVSSPDYKCQALIDFTLTGDTISGQATDLGKPAVPFTFRRVGGTSTGAPGKLLVGWKLPQRFGPDRNGDHLVDYFTTAAAISPSTWPVDVTVASSAGAGCPAGSYIFHVDGKAAPAKSIGACEYEVRFPKQGHQRLTASVKEGTTDHAGSAQVYVRDFLIAGLGDSNGSGEGNPDVPGTSPLWEDRRCDRSVNSFEPRAALMIDTYNPQTSVTFVHLACSGASVPQGLTGPYRGINDPGGAPIPSQLSQLDQLTGKRGVDALLLSIGVNDIDFSPLVQFCIAEDSCMDKPYPATSSAETLSAAVARKLAALPKRYALVNERLARIGVAARRVYITEYPDSTHDSTGSQFCNPLLRVYGQGTFDQAEARWAFLHVLTPLNRAVDAAAARYHWRVISGVAQDFAVHGYCSSQPWIVGLTESLANEGSPYGTLHANSAGHQAVAQTLATLLAVDLFPSGKPREP